MTEYVSLPDGVTPKDFFYNYTKNFPYNGTQEEINQYEKIYWACVNYMKPILDRLSAINGSRAEGVKNGEKYVVSIFNALVKTGELDTVENFKSEMNAYVEKGFAEGAYKAFRLCRELYNADRAGDIIKMCTDKSLIEKFYEEFNII